ncbi:hypothetical protein GCM10007972_05320 [Iodidimonas muriae]|uniref:DUF4810 domain-containing protein n=1 Tax=Iodidimonas muriae TaxID=261467 RepID=A0ABQ2L9Q9_9PROT|nr:DUF4810 domain-containing protein [Iodidimonas muriae]GER05758.1 hypothetical protein JCM17843_00680 [Kordiimonadales bacterium JCM 17843]GGO06769.1 hypothetical protein GCM10007972_05320 [Iodidimonas muriae]
MKRGTTAIAVVMALGLGACASKENSGLYDWNGYQGELLAYYKNPQENQAFSEQLYANIELAEQNDRVPPGIYAEYGYVLLQIGKTNEALAYFAKERDRWPESAYLMSKVIDRLGGATASLDENPSTDDTAQTNAAGQ